MLQNALGSHRGLAGWVAGWKAAWLAEWLLGELAGWPDWLESKLTGWMAGWPDGWLAACLLAAGYIPKKSVATLIGSRRLKSHRN